MSDITEKSQKIIQSLFDEVTIEDPRGDLEVISHALLSALAYVFDITGTESCRIDDGGEYVYQSEKVSREDYDNVIKFKKESGMIEDDLTITDDNGKLYEVPASIN